jgi:uncharacterized phiE125 gp8 family phage protein
MIFRPVKVITPPAKLPVTVAEVKSHLRVEIADDNLDIENKIKAVVSYLDPPDGILGRAMISQTLQISLADFPKGPIELPYPPVQSISASGIKYLNSSDAETTVSSLIYVLKNDQEPALIILKTGESWPTDFTENDPYPVKINFKAGYGDNPANVPETIRLWIMMAVGDFYLQRENILIGQSLTQNEFSRRFIDNFVYKYEHTGR